MRRRRLILIGIALLLLAGDGAWYVRRSAAPDATITYVRLDSASFVVSAQERGATFQGGRWDTDPAHSMHPPQVNSSVWGTAKTTLVLANLEPEGSFGKAMAIVRDLKRRRLCHLIIREGAMESDFRPHGTIDHDRTLGIPAFVLCGHEIGDAGFEGTLPPDHVIHLDE